MSEKAPVILVVDDNDGTRYALRRSLQRGGFEVVEAATGAEALRLAAGKPALITLDVRLPDILGFEVCRRLKADPATASIPVLQTSASFTQSADKVQGLQGGADGYLVQPIEPDELIATVQALLRIRRAEGLARELSSQWQSTFEAVSNGICIVDGLGRIERCNEAFSGFLGPSGDFMKGRPFEEIARAGGVRDEAYLDAVRQRRPETREIALGVNWFRATVNPIAGEGQLVCVFSDVTAIRYAESRLHRLNEDLEAGAKSRIQALEEANARLQSFCEAVSRDLQAPLRTLHELSERFLSEYGPALPPDGRELAERIRQEAGKLERVAQALSPGAAS